MKILIIIAVLFNMAYASFVDEVKGNIVGLSLPHQKRINKRLDIYVQITKQLQDKANAYKIIAINDFFNKFTYISDIKQYRKNDYWMNIKEFMISGKGDCEDFAIAKYYALLELGIPEASLKLLMTRFKGTYHVVLQYEVNSKNFILDNVNKTVSSKRTDLELLYVIPTKLEDKINSTSQSIAAYKFNKMASRI